MIPFKTLIKLDYNIDTPIFLQVTNSIIGAIKKGLLPAGTKLPGTRSMAKLIGLNRNTVVKAFEELFLQGWVKVKISKGFYINDKIPIVITKSHEENPINSNCRVSSKVGFKIKESPFITIPKDLPPNILHFNDGFPDIRLAPLKILSREYGNVLKQSGNNRFLWYNHPQGNERLRSEIQYYLQNSRGINATIDQILITRGSIMGIYLLINSIVSVGDRVVVGENNYVSADMMLKQAEAKIIRIGVDDDGLNIDELEKICYKNKIKAIYIASHHHHPTTAVLSAERRIKLLELAKEMNFAIIEDDYDYDYHYNSSPILPLISSDTDGYVSYVGSLSKTISPVFRIGFVVAPQNLILELCKLRRIFDRQGDFVLERAMATLFGEGEISRHLRKTQKEYKKTTRFIL